MVNGYVMMIEGIASVHNRREQAITDSEPAGYYFVEQAPGANHCGTM